MDPPADPPAHLPPRYPEEAYSPGSFRDAYSVSPSEPEEYYSPPTVDEARLNALLMTAPLEQEGHSLPTPDEVKNSNVFASSGTSNPYSGRRKRMWALLGVCLVVVTIIVTLSVTIPKKNENKSLTGSASALDGANSSGNSGGNGGSSGSGSSGPSNQDTTDPQRNPGSAVQVSVSRYDQVAGYLALKGITTAATLDNKNGPQHAAAMWIADYDRMQLPVPVPGTRDYEFEQRYILATFYYALDGPNWLSSLNFLSPSSVCDWNFAFNMTNELGKQNTWDLGATCGDSGNVEILFIGKLYCPRSYALLVPLLTPCNDSFCVNSGQWSLW